MENWSASKANSKWDERFLKLAEHVATWSKDLSTQTGAVIVRPNKSIASVGFNGFAQLMQDDPALYLNRDEKYSRIIHCEINALIFSREQLTNYTLYTWPFASCDRCCVQMLQAGIRRFVFPILPEDKKERWLIPLTKTKQYIQEAGALWIEL
jgi:dCMP deaminase